MTSVWGLQLLLYEALGCSSARGLKLLVYAAFSYEYMRSKAIRISGLRLRVYVALSY